MWIYDEKGFKKERKSLNLVLAKVNSIYIPEYCFFLFVVPQLDLLINELGCRIYSPVKYRARFLQKHT